MKYKVTIEEVSGDNKLVFETENQENIIRIVEKLKQHPDVDTEDAATFGVGLKLFSTIILKNKNTPLFKDFLPHFKTFMKTLKGSISK